MKPFVKWPGGKQWITRYFMHLFPTKYNTYYEPFLGGASVFFALQPPKATLSDINEELINLYTVMRDYPDELSKFLILHNSLHTKDYYYDIRRNNPSDSIQKAARTLYLNRTCFNGIYRVNKCGVFNVPIGTKTNCIYDISSFPDYSQALKSCKLYTNDFAKTIRSSVKNDLIFADPPYTSSTQDNCFIKYNDTLFSWDDQLRLHKELCDAKSRGTYVALTNKDNKEIEDLYSKSGFYIMHLKRSLSIQAKKKSSRQITELFITSYMPEKETTND